MNRVMRSFLERVVKHGDLTVTGADGESHRFGDGTGQPLRVRFTGSGTETSVMMNPSLKLGEAFMDGTFLVEEGRIYDVLALLFENLHGKEWRAARLYGQWRYLTRGLRQRNNERRARSNVAHHYDLDDRLYRLFLDSDRQYSCAYFESPDADLEDAQLAKKRHIAAKLDLKPGQKVLDIGSGWGGLGLYIADMAGGEVTGVTLSEEQFKVSNARAEERGLKSNARFLLQDYRSLTQKFDRIVSVGMFEHVGVPHYPEFFERARELLTDDGVMVLHSIGRFDGPNDTNAWIQKYIFPGGYIPALSEVIPVIERAGLKITDVEILRLHYAETLKAWRERFLARWDEAKSIYDERFCRMWEFYLAASETAFRQQGMMNFQIQLTKRNDALPLTRDYMFRAEADLREREAARQPLRLAGE